MWPNPRIPYQMSSDRPRLAPLNGDANGRVRLVGMSAGLRPLTQDSLWEIYPQTKFRQHIEYVFVTVPDSIVKLNS